MDLQPWWNFQLVTVPQFACSKKPTDPPSQTSQRFYASRMSKLPEKICSQGRQNMILGMEFYWNGGYSVKVSFHQRCLLRYDKHIKTLKDENFKKNACWKSSSDWEVAVFSWLSWSNITQIPTMSNCKALNSASRYKSNKESQGGIPKRKSTRSLKIPERDKFKRKGSSSNHHFLRFHAAFGGVNM